MKHWIQTHGRRRFNPIHPREADVSIYDVAHALSHECRFGGHASEFYSVAEHSINVADFLARSRGYEGHEWDDPLYVEAILHDAPEAYLRDLPKPVKASIWFWPYRVLERRIDRVVRARFDLPKRETPLVKWADSMMLWFEARRLMSPLLPGWGESVRGWDEIERRARSYAVSGHAPGIELLSSRDARAKFMSRFRRAMESRAWREGKENVE